MSWYIRRYICRFGFVSSSIINRNMGGQVQKIQTFGASLVSVSSMDKSTATGEQVQKLCNGRK